MIVGYQKRTFYPGGARPMCGEIMFWHRNAFGRDLPEEFLADMAIELHRLFTLSAEEPKYVFPERPFPIKLTVTNRGLRPVATKVTVYAEDATTDLPEQAIEVGPREARTVEWPFIAGKGTRPYVLFFEPDGDRGFALDVTGAILP